MIRNSEYHQRYSTWDNKIILYEIKKIHELKEKFIKYKTIKRKEISRIKQEEDNPRRRRLYGDKKML